MRRCGSCDAPCGEFDRFCGDCGAVLPDASDAEASPAPVSAALPQPPPQRRAGKKWVFASAAATAVLIGALGTTYFLISSGSDSGRVIRIALKDITDTIAPSRPPETPDAEETDEPEEELTPSETPAAQETSSPTEAPSAIAATAPDTLIAPGTWTFNTMLINVTKVDPSDASFRLNREGLGMSETNSQCITSSVAANPRAISFPLRGNMDCRASSFSMTGNRYRASMTCNFPQYGGRRPVEAEGRYSQTDVSVDLRVRVPAQVVSGDFQDIPEINLHYRVSGRRTQAC